MSTISLRESWQDQYKDLNLSNGIWANAHPFYTQVSDSLPETTLHQRQQSFPYRSLRSLANSLKWVKSFVPTRTTPHDYPSDASPGWTHKLNGVTHDDQYWYFAQQEKLWKVPVGHDLNAEFDDTFLSAGIPLEGYDHFGDIDYNEGLVYVPIEGHNHEPQLPAVVAIFDQNLQFRGSVRLTAQGASGPWCAVNPLNGFLYSSIFNDEPDRIRLQVYEQSLLTNRLNNFVELKLEHLGTMELFDEQGKELIVKGIQGGVFSRRGHLYLIIDTYDGGIMGFDMITGCRTLHSKVDYQPNNYATEGAIGGAVVGGILGNVVGGVAGSVAGAVLGGHFGEGTGRQAKDQELEGITIWEDVYAAGAPQISGQLHLIMLSKDIELLSDDDLYFKHYEVLASEDIEKV
jgi:hypothetical protein